ncbi:MAG: hypothetical protein ACOYY2_03980 [Actinomycetota bacterium]
MDSKDAALGALFASDRQGPLDAARRHQFLDVRFEMLVARLRQVSARWP